jgi:Putative auto-transporter adhesin, head GIN domain
MTKTNWKTPLLLLTFPMLLFSCRNFFGKRVHGNGNITTQDRPVNEFKDVEVGGAAKVYVSQGDQHTVKVEVDENLQQFVEVIQEGNKIIVRQKDNFNLDPTGDLKIYVTSPVYNNIDVSGACDIIGQTPINSPENLRMNISGAGDMKMEVNAPRISAEVSGSGNIDLKGETKSADLTLTGAGHAHCFELKSENTKIEISGAGSAQVYASVRLDAEVSGAGSVDYKGGAAVDQHVSGAGSVHKVD